MLVFEKTGSWTQVLLIYVMSILSAGVISEAAPVLGAIAATMHLHSAAATGLIMSIPALVVVFCALLIGGLGDLVGDKPVLIAGAAVVIAGDLGVLSASTMTTLLTWRIIEGAGYGCMSIASITMTTRITEGQRRTTALALWSTVIPASFLAAAALATVIARGDQWRSMFIAHSALTALSLVVGVAVLPRREKSLSSGGHLSGVLSVLCSPWPYILGVSFAAVAFFQTGMIAGLASLLGARIGATEGQVQPFTVLAMAFNMVGALGAGYLLNQGLKTWLLAVGAILICAVASFFLFFGPLNSAIAVTTNSLLLLGCGLLVGFWALLPLAATSFDTVGATSGLVTQITLLGVLFGPPAAFVAIGHGPSGAYLFLSISVIGTLVGLPFWLRKPRRVDFQ